MAKLDKMLLDKLLEKAEKMANLTSVDISYFESDIAIMKSFSTKEIMRILFELLKFTKINVAVSQVFGVEESTYLLRGFADSINEKTGLSVDFVKLLVAAYAMPDATFD